MNYDNNFISRISADDDELRPITENKYSIQEIKCVQLIELQNNPMHYYFLL